MSPEQQHRCIVLSLRDPHVPDLSGPACLNAMLCHASVLPLPCGGAKRYHGTRFDAGPAHATGKSIGQVIHANTASLIDRSRHKCKSASSSSTSTTCNSRCCWASCNWVVGCRLRRWICKELKLVTASSEKCIEDSWQPQVQ